MTPPARARPISVTLLTLGVLLFTIGYAIRFVAGLSLPPLPLSVPGWYLPLSGAVWLGCGAVALWAIGRRRPWTPAMIGWSCLVYALWQMADRVLLARSDFAELTLPGTAGLLLLGLAGVAWILRKTAARTYFEESANEPQ